MIDEAGAADAPAARGERKKTLGPREIEAVVAKMAKIPAKTSVSASDEERARASSSRS